MTKKITIKPISRIEGHGKITLHLNDEGEVDKALFHVTQVRGFEKICAGRPFYEMPSLTARICGICTVSHLMASAKACDALLAVRIPPAGGELRRLMNLAQIIQSHALSFFYLSSPDLLLGLDDEPQKRNVFELAKTHPQLIKDGIALRQFGQEVIQILGGKRIHPTWVVPGGVSEPLRLDQRDEILQRIPDALDCIQRTLTVKKRLLDQRREEARTFANFPSLFMSMVDDKGRLSYYDGHLRFMDATGKIIADNIEAEDYADWIGEAVEPWTYLKFPYYKPQGYPGGMYRVGPLARLNLIDYCGTPLADREWTEFRQIERGPTLSSFYYHYARLIEVLFCLERMQRLLDSPEILSKHVRAHAQVNALEGVGMVEAPRGTLIHHYEIDEEGLIQKANLVVATGHNNLAMNQGVLQVARHFIHGGKLEEGMLNRVEAVIRTFDPCLSCSTHAFGEMPLVVELYDAEGQKCDQLLRR
ncbi:Ni/Fe hydrogenase subunit alpha [Candidatus Sumerlaeota bacterium]|nr:Ni/Fe hydrogenase subunit alpha [Candidatus Sumerlaeota bacterium]